MNRFNLTFRGVILPGRDPVRARARFAEIFEIGDAQELEAIFSGETVVLRENLGRKEAGEYYASLRKIGLEAELVKVEPRPAERASGNAGLNKRQPKSGQPEQRNNHNANTIATGEVTSLEDVLRERRRREEQKKREATPVEAPASRQQLVEERKQGRKARSVARKQARAEEKRQRRTEAAVLKAAEAEAARLRKVQDDERRARMAETRRQKAADTRVRRERPTEAMRRDNDGKEAMLRGLGHRARGTAVNRASHPAEELSPAEVHIRRRELEEEALERGARALARNPTLRPVEAKVRSRLELPRSFTAYHAGTRGQQPGTPNIYRLHAFRNSETVRQRARLADIEARRGLLFGSVALALLFILVGTFINQSPPDPLQGPVALATSPSGRLTMLVEDRLLLHDRAGVPDGALNTGELGIGNPGPPMIYLDDFQLLLRGRAAQSEQDTRLLRCNLAERHCTPLARNLDAFSADAVVRHDISGSLILADAVQSRLVKLDSRGRLQASAERPLLDHPVLRLESGLLFTNSAEAPAISVLRFEDEAFGRQLDEILLLPPPALERNQSRVWDFERSGDFWWVTLFNPETGSAGAYLFDRDWKYVRQLDTNSAARSGQWVKWGQKLLLGNPRQQEVLRFSPQGEAEAPFHSQTLQQLQEDDANAAWIREIAWHLALLLTGVTVLFGYTYAAANALRSRVYRARSTRGADPLDDVSDHIEWVPVDPVRRPRLRRSIIAYSLLAVGLVLLAIGLGVSAAHLLALLLIVSGPFIALQILERNPIDHVGVLEESVVLVDHRETYHVGRGRRLQRCGPFLVIDDVAVYTGGKLLPALEPESFDLMVEPLLGAVSPLNRSTLLIILRDSGHPLARGGLSILAALLCALFVLALGSLPW